LIAYKGLRVGTNESRRHLTHYTKGIPGSAVFRNRLTQITSAEDALNILAELASTVEGPGGKERFLFAVEQDYLEYCKKPGEGNGDSEDRIQTPVNIGSVAPIAVP
jgi:hypothetical protein